MTRSTAVSSRPSQTESAPDSNILVPSEVAHLGSISWVRSTGAPNTGVFVESAVESAKKEHERFLLHTVQKLFNTTDDDKSGEITWQEFQNKLDHPDMRTYFKSIDLDLDEAQDLFKLIDIDDSGTIDPEAILGGGALALRIGRP